VIFEADMKWLEPEARKEMESALARFPQIDCVYAHNDPGAHGAYLAAKAAGREKEMLFVGIDALPHEGRLCRAGNSGCHIPVSDRRRGSDHQRAENTGR
jgi:ribose transport system substrate-binding protein